MVRDKTASSKLANSNEYFPLKRKHCRFFLGTQFSKDKTVCNLAKAADSKLWHKTIGHLNFIDIQNRILRRILHCANNVCEIHILCKFTKVSYLNETEIKNTKSLEKVFFDILGHFKPPSVQEIIFVLIIVDEYSNFKVVKFLRTKSDAPEKFKHFIAEHGNLELLRSDDGKSLLANILNGIALKTNPSRYL